MHPAAFDINLMLIYFIYGLAFFSMGTTLAFESGRFQALADARVLRPLAVFGLIHGTHEWLEAYLLQATAFGVQFPAWLDWFRLCLLVVSFIFLTGFGFQAFRSHPPKWSPAGYSLLAILTLYTLFILANTLNAIRSADIPWLDLLNALSRYLLAVPGAILAAAGLRVQAINSIGEERPHLLTHLTIAAIGFFIYGLAQFVVPHINMLPASIINTENFRSVFGFPVQIIRAAMAWMITLGFVRATLLTERERQRLAVLAQKAKVDALEQRDTLRHELLSHTVEAQEEERTRIARELHDETAQVLTAISLDLATLGKNSSNSPDVKRAVDRLQALSRQMAQGVYRLVHDLRPAQLDDLGLIPAIQYLKDRNAAQGLEVTVEVHGKVQRLDANVETVLFRVVQEALNNVLRHAQTRQAKVIVQFNQYGAVVKVVDAGVGFNPEIPLVPPHGWGLAGMHERVNLIGGELHINSDLGKGTTVEVTVPERGLFGSKARGT